MFYTCHLSKTEGAKTVMNTDPIIIIGGGQAAVQLCLALRKEKVTTPILVLSEEGEYPYHRPPLSKSFLSGETSEEKLLMRPESFYSSKDVDVKLNTRVDQIDPENHTVKTAGGDFSYQKLVITTGSRARPLPSAITGADAQFAGVHMIRTLQQSKHLKQELADAGNIVIIGAGFIGLEFAAVANKMGKSVTVYDQADRVMARAVSPNISTWFSQQHQSNGIEIQLKDSVSEIIGPNKVSEVVTVSGKRQPCDLLVAGIGVIANDEIASAAGLKCDDGIVVNEYCETSVADIYAAGDCAKHPNSFANNPDISSGNNMIRLESIQNATDQARVIAACIAGKRSEYSSVPWFWSDQGEYSLQIAGLSNASDTFIERGNPDENSFSVFHYRGTELQCVDSVNSPKDHMVARKLISSGISPTVEQSGDSSFELKTLLTAPK